MEVGTSAKTILLGALLRVCRVKNKYFNLRRNRTHKQNQQHTNKLSIKKEQNIIKTLFDFYLVQLFQNG